MTEAYLYYNITNEPKGLGDKKRSRPGQGQLKIIIWINFVWPESQMLYTKFLVLENFFY